MNISGSNGDAEALPPLPYFYNRRKYEKSKYSAREVHCIPE